MFQLENQTAKLSNVNLRAELHGEETKIAVDLKFDTKLSNDVLSYFDPDLKSSMYKQSSESAQGELIDVPGYLPALKFPKMSPIKWDWKGAGYEAVVNYGISGKDDIRMIQIEVDSFKFDFQDGGTVALSFRAIAHPTSDEIGRLSELVQREITLSLYPPSVEDQLKAELAGMGNDGDEE